MTLGVTKGYILGMDLGTSSLKCVIMDATGQIRASAERAYETRNPHPGWAEQNPNDWIEALRAAVAELRNRHANLIDSLVAIGLCSAAHIPVLLDDANRVIRPAILWSDQRSDAEVAELQAEFGARLAHITLNEAGCTWTLPQLRWVSKHEPNIFSRTCSLLSSKDYLLSRLTGQCSMDYGSAAATLMFDARKKMWSPELKAASGLPDSAFPALAHPMAIVGNIDAEGANIFGLPRGVPVIAGTLDSAAEMVGCGLLVSGEGGMVRVGSAGGIMVVTDTPTFNHGIITYPHVIDGLYYKQAGTNSCATSLKWIRDLCMSMCPADSPALTFDELDRIAAQANPGADGLMFHPYIQGERAPYWNAELRGSFTGIDQQHRWPQFARAVMEGVAFSLLDGLSMFRADGMEMMSAVMSGGVVKSKVWSQIITDVLEMETYTIRHGDSAFGASILAATAVGMFDNIRDAVTSCVRVDRTMTPNIKNYDLYRMALARYRETGHFLDAMAKKYARGAIH
jgi:xylulokinase